MTNAETAALTIDATNRSVRSFVQGAAIDIAVAVAALVLTMVDTISTKAGLVAFGIAFVKTVLTSIASFVMRRYLDKSSVPTPTPPSDSTYGG